MPTANYSLPTISGEEVIDIVGDMNALANATDAALKKVEQGGLDPYVLPTATRTVKGGVIVGDGLSITSGGVLSTVSQGGGGGSATLPVATSVTLGGVKIGSGITVTPDGTISVPASSSIEDGAVTSSKLASGAVTADKLSASAVTSVKIDNGAVTEGKIANGAVTSSKLSSDVSEDISNAKSQAASAYQGWSGTPTRAGSFSSGQGMVESWGKVVVVHCEQIPVANASKTLVGTVSGAYRPISETTGVVAAIGGSGTVSAFLKVETGGNIYINPGSAAGLNWTGTLVYLVS